MFSVALCRGLIEAVTLTCGVGIFMVFSVALCRGLIEAVKPGGSLHRQDSFSVALCRGLIEALRTGTIVPLAFAVFRGFMPRPH